MLESVDGSQVWRQRPRFSRAHRMGSYPTPTIIPRLANCVKIERCPDVALWVVILGATDDAWTNGTEADQAFLHALSCFPFMGISFLPMGMPAAFFPFAGAFWFPLRFIESPLLNEVLSVPRPPWFAALSKGLRAEVPNRHVHLLYLAPCLLSPDREVLVFAVTR